VPGKSIHRKIGSLAPPTLEDDDEDEDEDDSRWKLFSLDPGDPGVPGVPGVVQSVV